MTDDPAEPAWNRAKPVLVVIVALAAAAAALLVWRVGGGDSSPDDDASSQGATPPPGWEAPPKAEPLWTLEAEAAGASTTFADVVAVDDGFVAATHGNLYAVDESGEPYWDRQMPVDLYGISVAPDTVVADYTDPDDTRERPDDVFEVIDVVTGETLWEDEVSYLAAVFAETVYTFECTRTSDDEFDECELSARDMDTGEARWTEPVRPDATIYTAYHMDHFEAAPADPPYLVLYSDGQAGAVDPADGKALAASVESPHPVNALAAEDVLVSVDDASASPDDGCRATLRGYDVESGKERWETQVSLAVTAKGYGEGQDCDVLWWWARDGDLLAVRDADGVPQTLDLATGEVRAQASEPGTVLATDGEFMLVRDGADGEVGDLTCYDLSSGEVAWTAADPQVELGQLRPRMHGDHVVAASTGYVDDAIVYDRAAGEELMAPPGELAGSGEGWLAAWTTTDDADIVEFSFYALS